MKLGKYTLLHKIATGGMAEIFLAKQEGPAGFEKIVVIKRILPHLAEDENFVTMFLNEARLAALLNHPNVVSIFDLGEHDGSYFIAMEYIHGRSLDKILAQSKKKNIDIPLEITARIIADACIGLDYAHKYQSSDGTPLNLVHRDVSPQNIIVSFDGLVKVVDFGVAKAATNTGKTQTGAVKGKYGYMSPEQIAGAHLDARSDVFALGVVLYELALGKHPFGDDTNLLAITAILNEAPPAPTEIVPGFPGTMEEIIFRALEKDRDRRYKDAQELQTDLERFIRSIGKYVTAREVAEFMRGLFGEEAEENLALKAREMSPLQTDEESTTVLDVDESVPGSLQAGGTPAEPEVADGLAGGEAGDDDEDGEAVTVVQPIPEGATPQVAAQELSQSESEAAAASQSGEAGATPRPGEPEDTAEPAQPGASGPDSAASHVIQEQTGSGFGGVVVGILLAGLIVVGAGGYLAYRFLYQSTGSPVTEEGSEGDEVPQDQEAVSAPYDPDEAQAGSTPPQGPPHQDRPQAPQAGAKATLSVFVGKGAAVYIDDIFAGHGPLSGRKLDPGVHRIKVVAPDGKVVERVVTLGPGKLKTINILK